MPQIMGVGFYERFLLIFAMVVLGIGNADAAQGERSREVAEWVISKNGSVTLLVNGRRSPPIRDVGQLPAGPLNVNEIDLRNTITADADMARFAQVAELQRILLIGLPISDVGFKSLAALRDLRVLEISETKITDVGLRGIAHFKKLESLTLDGTKVTNASMKLIGSFPELTVLKLSSTTITDENLGDLAGLKKLDILALNDVRITDAGIAKLAALSSVRQLRLTATAVTDAAVPNLSKMTRLRKLQLVGSGVTKSGYDALTSALPGCEIMWRAELVRQATQAVQGSVAVTVESSRRLQPTTIEEFCQGPVPSFLRKAVIYGYTPTVGSHESLGSVRVDFKQDTALYFAGSWDPREEEGPWSKEAIVQYNIERDGWVLVGALNFADPSLDPHLLYWKQFRRGDSVTLRTRKLLTPLVIVPEDPKSDPLAQVPDDAMHPGLADWIARSKIQRILRARQFAELEAIVAKLRIDKPRNKNGRPLLSIFYDGVHAEAVGEAQWLEERKLFEAWAQAHPKSAAAQCALARFWFDYAFEGRRTGNTRYPTEEGMRLYMERMGKARDLIKNAYKLTEKDPYVCRVDAQIASDLAYEAEEIPKIIERSLAIDPDYHGTLIDATRYYLPTIRGKPGDLEKYADRCVELTRERHGESLYALIVGEVMDYRAAKTFTDFEFSWDRVKQGFDDLRKRDPKSISNEVSRLKLAGFRNDREEAKAAVARIDELGYMPFFVDGAMDKWRRWAQDDFTSGDQSQLFTVLQNPILRLEWTIEGKRLVALDVLSRLSVINAADGMLVSRTNSPQKSLAKFSALVPFAQKLIATDWDDQIVLYKLPEGDQQVLGVHEGATASALATDGAEWATAGRDKKIRFWNLDDVEQPAVEWDMAPATVTALGYIPNSRTIAIGDQENRIGFWNLDTKEKSVELTPRKGTIRMLRVSADGNLLAVVDTREITLWRIKQFELLTSMPLPSQPIVDMTFSRDGRYLAVGTGNLRLKTDCNVVVWNTADGSLRHTFRGHKELVRAVTFSPDGKKIASSGDDMTIRIWNND